MFDSRHSVLVWGHNPPRTRLSVTCTHHQVFGRQLRRNGKIVKYMHAYIYVDELGRRRRRVAHIIGHQIKSKVAI